MVSVHYLMTKLPRKNQKPITASWFKVLTTKTSINNGKQHSSTRCLTRYVSTFFQKNSHDWQEGLLFTLYLRKVNFSGQVIVSKAAVQPDSSDIPAL